MEIGIDIEQNSRFENASDKFLNRVFTKNELAYAKKFDDPAPKFCANWCVKEAVIKAFSNAKLSYSDIELSRDKNGKPFVVVSKNIQEALDERGYNEIKISLSHSKEYSTAICILN